MNIHRKGYLFLLILSVLCLSGCVIHQNDLAGIMKKEARTSQQQKEEAQPIEEKETDTAEEKENSQAQTKVFEGRDMEGNVITSAVFSKSKLTMVNVWATYCNPCLKEMPGLGELAGEYDQSEFQLLGIISDVQENDTQEMLDYAVDLIEQTGADYPHLLLNRSIYDALLTGVVAVPTTFFFNSEGELLDTVVGSMEKKEWKERIDAFLEK